jgi:hypothetical protein
MHAVVDLVDQNSRMKDYYDLYQILSKDDYNKEMLKDAIEKTFENRYTKFSLDNMFFRSDFSSSESIEIKWNAFNRKIMNKSSMSFFEIATFLQNTLKHGILY